MPTPPEDPLYAEWPKKLRTTQVVQDGGSGEQLGFFAKALEQWHRKQRKVIAHPFDESACKY